MVICIVLNKQIERQIYTYIQIDGCIVYPFSLTLSFSIFLSLSLCVRLSLQISHFLPLLLITAVSVDMINHELDKSLSSPSPLHLPLLCIYLSPSPPFIGAKLLYIFEPKNYNFHLASFCTQKCLPHEQFKMFQCLICLNCFMSSTSLKCVKTLVNVEYF